MLTPRRTLSLSDLAALADLERRVISVDGGRIKLEWATLRTRVGEGVQDLMWWVGGDLVGFLGLYAFGGPDLELAGAVDPAVRRRGIGSALLASALGLARERGVASALLVVPHGVDAGTKFAFRHRGVLDHAEHSLVMKGPPRPGPYDDRTSLREAGAADSTVVGTVLAQAFGNATEPSSAPAAPTRALPPTGADHWAIPAVTSPHPPDGPAGPLPDGWSRTLVIEHRGVPVGTLRIGRTGDEGTVHGFAVQPDWQGQGIGRDVLARVCTGLHDGGVSRVRLEVVVDNDRALRLYTSLGFVRETGEDYYALRVG